MSFLQPVLLAALPLVALPIIIHLINQRRYQTVRWAAMMFLQAAQRMSRGHARIRQWLIMAARMAAIAGLIFAISRPLAGGWLGLAGGGRADAAILLIDRSPSMSATISGAGRSKLETGLAQLARALETLGSNRWVVIDGAQGHPRELASIADLPRLPGVGPSSASADLPGMLRVAHDYIKANQTGRTEIWICSDNRSNDWRAESGRWAALRESFARFPQTVRFHLLAYPEPAARNLSIRVTEARRRKTANGAELLISLRLAREAAEGAPAATATATETVPVQIEIAGARSEVAVELSGAETALEAHRVPLGKGQERGWGRVSIPADANPLDNDYYFVFEPPAPRKTIVVAEDAAAARALELAASIAPDPSIPCTAEILAPDRLASADWEHAALVLWNAPLPEIEAGRISDSKFQISDSKSKISDSKFQISDSETLDSRIEESKVEGPDGGRDAGPDRARSSTGPDGGGGGPLLSFIRRGGAVVFFPPSGPSASSVLGARWMEWHEEKEGATIDRWRGDEDLLAHTQSGAPLPVGSLRVRRWRGLTADEGALTPLASFRDGSPFLARATTDAGAVYFCATTPSARDSSLATDGVVFYVLVRRALDFGAAALGGARQLVAGGPVPGDPLKWKRVAGGDDGTSAEYAIQRGVYESAGRLLAVNRSAEEAPAPVLADRRIDALFRGLDFDRVSDRAGSLAAIVQEIWRPFLAAMMLALVAESVLCLPRRTRPQPRAADRFPAAGGPSS